MLKKLHRLQTEFLIDCRGIVLVYTLLVLVPILGAAGFAVDTAHLSYMKTRMQNAADASAMAGADLIPFEIESLTSNERAAIIAEAQLYAQTNMSSETYGTVLPSSSIQIGFFDMDGTYGTARQFHTEGGIPSGANLNAVRTEVIQSEDNGNAIRNMFVAALGQETTNLSVVAIAFRLTGTTLPPCVSNGFMALGTTDGQSNSILVEGACLHADGGLEIGQNTCVQVGEQGITATFSVSDSLDANLGGNAEAVEDPEDCGTYEAVPIDLNSMLVEASLSDFLLQPDDFIFDLSLPAGHPDHVTGLEEYIDGFRGSADDPGWPDCQGLVQQGGRTIINQSYETPCVAIVEGDLELKRQGSGGLEFDNIMLLVKGDVTFASDTIMGIPATCDTLGASDSLIIASEGVGGPAKVSLYGTQMILGGDMGLAAQGTTVGACILSSADIQFSSQWDISGCADNEPPLSFPEAADDDPPQSSRLVF